MKSKNYVITYLSALAIGILLLIYHQQQALYQTIVVVIGALVAVPSLVLLLTMLLRRRPAEGVSAGSKAIAVATELASAAGVAFGIWMMCSPHFFITAIIYTLGAILILVGLAQICYIFQAARPYRAAAGWFIVPVLTLVAGIVLVILGPDKVASAAGLVTGIVLVVYAANGFASAGREAKLQRDMQKLEHEARHEEQTLRHDLTDAVDAAADGADDRKNGNDNPSPADNAKASEPDRVSGQ
ncbi:MAG: DUF308 domain-containing protein [Muribaculaceae bacterium]|nr:DUF308 domain-containing protein [Muribaculaceae bacterium]MDE7080397.1 DUF308 domain-containing protein [Muribaculaceae bacterium]